MHGCDCVAGGLVWLTRVFSFKVRYTSVHEYLFLLRFLATELNHCGSKGLIYSAAAVSDFYIPFNEMVQPFILLNSPYKLEI